MRLGFLRSNGVLFQHFICIHIFVQLVKESPQNAGSQYRTSPSDPLGFMPDIVPPVRFRPPAPRRFSVDYAYTHYALLARYLFDINHI